MEDRPFAHCPAPCVQDKRLRSTVLPPSYQRTCVTAYKVAKGFILTPSPLRKQSHYTSPLRMQFATNFLALQALVAGAVSAAILPRDSTATNSSAPTSISPENPFPTNVGYAGTFKYGAPPFLAVTDRIPGELKDSAIETRWEPIDACDSDDFKIFQHLGNESPYFSSPIFADFQKDNAVLPETCTVKQVHILHRHGGEFSFFFLRTGL